MQTQTRAYLYAIAAVLLWSTVSSAFKLTLRHVDFLQMLCGSAGVSTMFLFLAIVVQGKMGLLRECTARGILSSALIGLLNPFLYYVVLFKAYSILTAQETLALNYTWPIMLVVLSIPLLKQKITVKSIAALLISFTGVLVIATGGNVTGFRFTNPVGVALALFSAVVWALYWIFNVRDTREEVVKLFLSFLSGCFFIVITTVLFSEVRMPDAAGIIGIVYIGLFEMGLTFVLWLTALRLSTTTAKVSNLVFVSPFLALVFIHFTVGEEIARSTVIGLTFIVAGLIVQHHESRTTAQE